MDPLYCLLFEGPTTGTLQAPIPGSRYEVVGSKKAILKLYSLVLWEGHCREMFSPSVSICGGDPLTYEELHYTGLGFRETPEDS